MRYLVAAPKGMTPLEVERILGAVAVEFQARIVRRRPLPVPAGSMAFEVGPPTGQVPLVVVATPTGVRVEVIRGADDWSRQRAAGLARRLGELLGDV